MASSVGRMSASAKKQVCRIVFTLGPSPASDRDRVRIHDEHTQALSTIACWASKGRCSHTVSGPNGLFRRNVRSRCGDVEDIRAVEETELVAGDEIGLPGPDEIRRPDRTRPEPQVRDGHRARLLRVVDEVALRVQLGALADDLDRALVRAHRPVGPKAEEHGADDLFVLGHERTVDIERGVRDVVDDPHREVRLGELLRQLVEHGLGHRGIELLRGQAVPASDDPGIGP